MAEQKTHARVLRVFLAAPRDTIDARDALGRAVESINRVTGRQDGFRVELVHWSTDTHPAIGGDTQSVVNTQIGDYDLLLVVLNQQYGTPTPRADSGTEEEYDRALLRYLQNSQSVQILVYFADPLVRLHSIDPIALGQIRRFRGRLERDGVLYGTYQDLAELERLVTVQLTDACRQFISGVPKKLRTRTLLPPTSREVLQQADWIAESRIVYPQSANYREIDLSPHRRDSISFTGKLRTESPYFRFGFKLSGLQQRVLGDGSIQTPDPNVVFHLGKNTDTDQVFYTIYRNGKRIGKDHVLLSNVNPTLGVLVSLTIANDNAVGFQVNGQIVHEDYLPDEARSRLALLMWSDEHQCRVEFTEVLLELPRKSR